MSLFNSQLNANVDNDGKYLYLFVVLQHSTNLKLKLRPSEFAHSELKFRERATSPFAMMLKKKTKHKSKIAQLIAKIEV